MDHELIRPVGTFGWFAMLIIGPFYRRRLIDLIVPVLGAMLIMDAWAVAPIQLHENPSRSFAISVWVCALFPYAVTISWLVKTIKS